MAKHRPATRQTSPSRSVQSADWAFHADDDAVLDALVSGRHAQSLREYFGTPAYAQLSVLAAAAKRAKKPRGPKVLILPGIMGSKIGDAPRNAAAGARTGTRRRGAPSKVLWIDPLQIAAGRLTALALPSGRALCAVGVLLFSYAKLKLELELGGREARFHAYDWRLGLDELGAQLAASIVADREPVILVAHSMGGLVARMAARMLPKRWVRRLIMLGTPNEGSFASVQALRGTYPFVRKMSRLDHRHSAEYLAAKVLTPFPGCTTCCRRGAWRESTCSIRAAGRRTAPRRAPGFSGKWRPYAPHSHRRIHAWFISSASIRRRWSACAAPPSDLNTS